MQLSIEHQWVDYIKKLERFVEKNAKNPTYIYDQEYDVVSEANNLELYDIFLNKLKYSIFSNRHNSPIGLLEQGREDFINLSVLEQCYILKNILRIFGRDGKGGCDLRKIGGKANSAATKGLSVKVSNWKKNSRDVRVIYQSPSGLWENQSQNILELL